MCISIFLLLVLLPKHGKLKIIRKNVFACLFRVHNTISLHVMNKYVLLGYIIGPMMGEVSLET